MTHNIIKDFFLYLAAFIANSWKSGLPIQNGNFSTFSLLWRPFSVTKAKVKVKYILMNQSAEVGEKPLSVDQKTSDSLLFNLPKF